MSKNEWSETHAGKMGVGEGGGVWALKNIQKHPSKPLGNLKNTKCDAYQLALWRIYIYIYMHIYIYMDYNYY